MKISCLVFALNTVTVKQKIENVFLELRKKNFSPVNLSFRARDESLCCVISFTCLSEIKDEAFFELLYNILCDEQVETFGITTNSSKYTIWDCGTATWT